MDIDLWEFHMLELLWEHEVAFQSLVCFVEEGGQLHMECSIVIESIEIIDNEWGDCLLFTKVKPDRATEIMRHPCYDGIGVDI